MSFQGASLTHRAESEREVRSERLMELILGVLERFKGKVYRCSELSECIDRLVQEMDREIRSSSEGYCFIESHDNSGMTIACGLLETLFITIDYDVEEAVRVEGFRVE